MTTKFAWRYFKSKKSTNAINIIAWISVVAIALVTASLIVVLSVFNGFEELVKSLYGDFYSDIKITAAKGKWVNASNGLLTELRQNSGIKSVQPIVEERAILVDQEDKSIVWLKGISTDFADVSGLGKHIARGVFEIGTTEHPMIVLGAGVENALQLESDRALAPLNVYLPNRNAKSFAEPLEALNSATAMPTGSFVIQQEFDNQYAFTNIGFLRYMLDLKPTEATAIEIFTYPKTNIGDLQKELTKKLGSGYTLKTRFQQNQNLYAAMQAEKLIIYAVAILILIIAAFNIISSLTMTVLEKQQDIAVLQAMGTTSSNVSTIFLKLGAILAGMGGLAGFALGSFICIGQQHWHWVRLGGQSFLIDYYPVAMRPADFAVVFIIIFIIAFFSGWLPSRKAAKTEYSLKS